MGLLLDTDLLPERDRAEALRAVYASANPRRDVVPGPGRVRHRVERLALAPGLHLLRTGGTALQIVRTERHVRSEAPEHVAIGIPRRGTTHVSAGGADLDMPVGHLTCVDMTRPYRLVHETAQEHDVLILDVREAGLSVDVVRAAGAGLRHSPLYDLVRRHLVGLVDAHRDLAPEPARLTGRATSALVTALLTSAAQSRGGAQAAEQALGARIALHLDANLHDADLTMDAVAAAHGISLRHLYAVWARSGHEQTPAQWLLARRLDRARTLLVSGDAARLGVGTVARRCGFADGSHFSRRFREAYGVSPREWRATHGTPGPASSPGY